MSVIVIDNNKENDNPVDDDDIKPGDSASQQGSDVSTTSASWRLRAKAKAAGLAAELMALKEQQDLEMEEQRLEMEELKLKMQMKQRREELQLRTKLRVAEAEESVYEENRSAIKCSSLTKSTGAHSSGHKAYQTTNSEEGGHGGGQSTIHPESLPPARKLTIQPEFLPLAKESTFSQRDTKSTDQGPQDITHQPFKQLLETINISNVEIMKFDGNPLNFFEFIRSFDSVIGESSLDNNTKLLKLYNLCTDRPKDIIRCCLMLNPDDGYHHARSLLADRFGSKFKIADAWVKKVTEGPGIQNTPKHLRDFSDQLKTCAETLMAIGMIHEMSSRSELVKIIERLPFHLRSRWLRHVKAIRDSGRSTCMQDVVEFINNAADELNDPVFGDLLRTGSTKSAGKATGRVFAASVNTPTGGCIMCEGDHTLFACQGFIKMSPDERRDFAFKSRLCFNCLRPGHVSAKCNMNRTCTVEGCRQKHTKFLHVGRVTRSSRNLHDSTTQTESEVASFASCGPKGAGSLGGSRVALPIIPVTVRLPGGELSIETYALLDPGSTNSFCLQELANVFKIKGKKKILKVATLESHNTIIECVRVKLVVKGALQSKEVEAEFLTRPSLNISIGSMAREEDLSKYKHFTGIEIPYTMTKRVTMLIGQDVPEALVPLEIKAGAPGEPYAVRTLLGWTINGPIANGFQKYQTSSSCSFISDDSNMLLEEQVHKFWKLEGTDYLRDDERGMSVNDRMALKTWQEGVCRDGDHYQLPIPFRKKPEDLPNNIQVASNRLVSLRRRLEKDASLHAKYSEGMISLLQEGYAEEVHEDDAEKREGVWYLPHHPVFNPNKPDKTRIVFDCASKYNGTSLNDVVAQGPDLTNNLLGVLLRFRQESVAIMGDIKTMFHQVRVPSEQRDFLRFLWWPEGDLTRQPKAYRMTVHLFGGTWCPSACSFALKHTAEEQRDEFSSQAVEAVNRNFYVDDCLVSCKTENDAIQLVDELSTMLDKGGFKITKWVSSSPAVIESVPEEDRATNVVGLDLNHDALPVERALGVTWDVELDCLTYKFTSKDKPITRRGILSEVASIYDPYGYASPFVLVAKKILQELTALKIGFDDPIPDEHRLKWLKWKEYLPLMSNFRVSRCFKPFNEVNKYQIHHFCDASESAYGVVSYLRMTSGEGQVHCNIVLAKSRLAPLKKKTTPRLELMAATLAVSMDKKIRRELDYHLDESVFWTDSTIVLHYISSDDKRLRTFVANRVSTIRDASDPRQWRYVNSLRNPADDVSRGLTPDKLNDRWLNGPAFLWCDVQQWPTTPIDLLGTRQEELEIKQPKENSMTFSTQSDERPLEKLINRYSSWYKLRRAVCWILKFKQWLKLKGKVHTEQQLKDLKQISFNNMQNAEKGILHWVQECFFQKEMELLTNSPGKVSRSSQLYRLDPKIDEGLVRVGGRLERSALPLESKHPVILPKGSHVSELILREVHQRAGHSGRNHVLSVLREKYWMLGAGTAIRSMIGRCVECRKQRGKMMRQKMADLPENRLLPDEPPFTKIGIDYFGPFLVKRGRSMEKRYGVIFTCLATRAIHLEVAHSLDTDSCINALRRFIARRGNVKEILSDNGTNLVGAERELKREIYGWNKARINAELLQRNIEWTFNPPTASHFGGVWERQIRTVRKLILAIAKQQVLSDESLSTLFCEIETIVNNRPLTRVSDDINDLEALTPNHLLLLNRNPQLPPTVSNSSDVYSKRRWRQVQYLADVFWRRWSKEYLPQLQERKKWVTTYRGLQIGDLILVADGNTPRNSWLLGRVLQIFPDKKGFTRSAEIKTKSSIIVRPISKLCLILEGDL